MTEWALVLTPLLVLPILLLFRFVGCGLNAVGTLHLPVPRYPEFILWDPAKPPVAAFPHRQVIPNRADVVAYWRLIDPLKVQNRDFPMTAPATDEKRESPPNSSGTGREQDGWYHKVETPIVEMPTPSEAGSESALGTVDPGTVSLLLSDPGVRCRQFNGGCVIVDSAGLHPADFTIEAWVLATWGTNAISGFEHTIFSAGAPASNTQARQGFSLFANRQNAWAVRLAPAGDIVFDKPAPAVDMSQRTHIALTVQAEGTGKRVRLFVNAKDAGHAIVPSYAPANGRALFIGAADKEDAGVFRTFIGNIQEVVLHKKALSLEELENHVGINKPRV